MKAGELKKLLLDIDDDVRVTLEVIGASAKKRGAKGYITGVWTEDTQFIMVGKVSKRTS